MASGGADGADRQSPRDDAEASRVELAALRAENDALRAENAALRAQLAHADRVARSLPQAEHELRAQRTLLRTVIDEIPDFIILKDHKGDFLLGNAPVAQFYGTRPEDMVGKHDGDFSATPEQAEFFRQNVLGIMARGETEIVFEESTDDATGETRYFKSIKKPFTGENGLPQILVIAHDITDIRRAQIQVAESERRLQYVLQVIGEGVWDWDIPTGRLAHNARWYQMLGLDPAELTHTVADFEQRLLEEERPAVDDAIARCLSGAGPYSHVHRMRRGDGTVIWVLDRGDVVQRAPDGRPLRMIGSFSDITERRRAEEHIERVNANLEGLVAERTNELSTSNAALQETLLRLKATQQELVEREKLAALGSLVAGVAHEINTPLGVAVTAASLWQDRANLLRAALDAGSMRRSELVTYLDLADQLAAVISNNLARAVTLVRDFKQVAVRQSTDDVEEFALLEAVQAAVTSVAPEWRRTSVRVSVDGDTGVRLRAAPGFVFQVVSNLVVNALRHAYPNHEPGDVRFTVTRVGAEACLRYRDDGVGIPPDVLPHIYEPFFTTRRGSGGSGLGLHIVWNLITAQVNGRIETTSEPGHGLSVAMYLPCLPAG